ncbi:GTPase activator [Glugoides intestinalis]
MYNLSTQAKKIEIILKAIRETKTRTKESKICPMVKEPYQIQPYHSFSALNSYQRGLLRKRCIEALEKPKEKPFMTIFCTPAVSRKSKVIHTSILELISTVKAKCFDEPGIFRKEGDKLTYKKIVQDIINEKAVDFSNYTILILGSVLKCYIRDYLNGFFEAALLETIINELKNGNDETAQKLCRYLIFSMNPMQRKCFLALQDLFHTITNNHEVTKITSESLCNILCLTMTPKEVVKNVEILTLLPKLFNRLIWCDIENIHGLEYMIVYFE